MKPLRDHPEIRRRQQRVKGLDFSERGTDEERAAHILELYRIWSPSRKRANAVMLSEKEGDNGRRH